MSKRKLDALKALPSSHGSKKIKQATLHKVPLGNTTSLVEDSDSSTNSENETEGGAPLKETGFKINTEYAKRFEYNKKREELHELEEKYQKKPKPTKGDYGDKYDEDSESSSNEVEDDNGILATEDLDAEISATLQAIRSRDPRVYDEKSTFYAPIEDEDSDELGTVKDENPVYLRDYHRENLLAGYSSAIDDVVASPPRTFAQEQADLKKSVVKQIHEAAEASSEADEEEGGFLIPKSKVVVPIKNGVHPSRVSKIEVDLTIADKDPETFLSNFMSARAWVPSDGGAYQPLESDDDEELERAEKFEMAYNLRFEDPKGSNEMLKSYARDVAAAKSVRREEPKSRKKARDAEREKREEEKRGKEEEKARLRKLKIEEMEEKLQKIKRAAGIRGKTLKDTEWRGFLDEGWDDDTWEVEMNKRFGEDYYAEPEKGSEGDTDNEGIGSEVKKRKVKKPTWDDEIDITDIIPEFEEEEEANEKPAFTLSDSDADSEAEDEGAAIAMKENKSKDHHQEKLAKKKAARVERKKIEDLVDARLDIDHAILPSKSKKASYFRYRETSPTSFGLTAQDILMADDTRLNDFVGLKKMATFRDAEKKRKDKKRLGKKARLREWRRETFGNENGPEIVIASPIREKILKESSGVNIVEGKKKRTRSKKQKGSLVLSR